MHSQLIPSKRLWIVRVTLTGSDEPVRTWQRIKEQTYPLIKKHRLRTGDLINTVCGLIIFDVSQGFWQIQWDTIPVRGSRFSEEALLHIRWNRTASTSRGRCYLLSLCSNALWSISWISFWRRPGPFPGKYVLTVVALRLLSQFRFINVVLPFRHLGCLWISRVDERFQGNRTKYSFHRNTYTSSYSHSQAHWPRWRRPPTIESSSHFAQPLQTLHSPCALGVYYYAWRHPVTDAARMSVKFTEYPVKL